MLHQTLNPPFFRFPFPPSSSIPPPAAAGLLHAALPSAPTTAPYFRSSQVEREEVKMESVEASALKNGCRREASPMTHQSPQQGLAEDAAWAAERGNLLGEEFSVDDLLDFGGLEGGKEEEEEEEAKAEAFEVENSNSSSSSSALSFEPPPPSDIILPAHDAAELEWVSRIMDETEFPPSLGVAHHRPASQNQTLTQTHNESQPENPRAPAPPQPKPLCSLSTEAVVPVKAKRSKRPRTTGGAWPTFSAATFADSSASTTTTSSSSSCSSSPSDYSCLIYNNAPIFLDGNPAQPKKHQPKKRGRKPKHTPFPTASGGGGGVLGERRCSHCGTQKTPQWRAGPMGSKTLCNACGVRFKSGRLLPEYRPACSPTFMSHVHSNSHRKVLEMRRKKEDQVLVASAPPVPSF